MTTLMAKKLSPDQLLSVAPAAEYLGIVPRSLHYHVQVGNIEPAQQVQMGSGTVNLFTVASLDALRERIRPGGKPGKGRPRRGEAKQ